MRYRIYEGTLPALTSLVDSTTGGVADTSKVIHGLTNDTTYYFRLTAVKSTGIESDYSIEITATPGAVAVPLTMNNKWNMVSIPLTVADYKKSVLFPSAVSKAFFYEGSYIAKDTLANGMGYWLKFSNNECDSVMGFLLPQDTIDVNMGWNMVGSISVPIAAAQVISDPAGNVTSNFFGFAKGYTINDTIQPGKGYWVKVNQNGKLILTSLTGALSASNRIKIVASEELPPAPPDDNEPAIAIPKVYALEQNYPNPFNPTTAINYGLPAASDVRLRIYNLLGQVVSTLVDGVQDAGYQTAEWNASSAASGIYFYRLEATSTTDPTKSFTQVKKMLLLK